MKHEDITVFKDSWTLVASDYTYQSVQLKGQGVILILLNEGSDPGDEVTAGTVLSGDGASASLGGLPEGISMWVKSFRDPTETVCVLAYSPT